MSYFTRRIRRCWWRLRPQIAASLAMNVREPLTVFIAFHHEARLTHLDGHVRNVLACDFVDRLIISNQTPLPSLEHLTQVQDRRLTWLDHYPPTGPAHRWHAAREFRPSYLLVIDDDVLLSPSQIAGLFRRLRADPVRPHGISGIVVGPLQDMQFVDRRDSEVTFLCEVYAVSGGVLDRYPEIEGTIAANVASVGAMDFAAISTCGRRPAVIHDIGHILRCETFKTPGIAVHREPGFSAALQATTEILAKLSARR